MHLKQMYMEACFNLKLKNKNSNFEMKFKIQKKSHTFSPAVKIQSQCDMEKHIVSFKITIQISEKSCCET